MGRKTQPVYLDYNATVPLLPEVKSALLNFMDDVGNPSSVHREGARAKQHLNTVRRIVGEALGAHPDYVIFTSGGTEANNQALRAVDWDHVLISTIEHDSLLKAREHVTLIPVDEEGLLDLTALEALLQSLEGKILISVMWANNETGVIQPMEEIVQIAKAHGAFVHTDAAQVIGKIPFSFDKIGLDMLSFSGHKFGAPQGVGVLIARETVPLGAFIRGGGQERNRRGGTENMMAIRGLGVALQNLPDLGHLASFQREIENAFSQKKEAVIFSKNAPRLTNTISVAIPGFDNMNQVIQFDLHQICVSAGSACSSGKVGPSRVLEAISKEKTLASSAIRVSMGWHTTADDVGAFIRVWRTLYDDFILSGGSRSCQKN